MPPEGRPGSGIGACRFEVFKHALRPRLVERGDDAGQQIPPDESFTAGLPGDATSDKIVRAVAGLAADLHLDCTVAGVETTAQWKKPPKVSGPWAAPGPIMTTGHGSGNSLSRRFPHMGECSAAEVRAHAS